MCVCVFVCVCVRVCVQDEEYRERRRKIVDISQTYKIGESIPRVSYSDNETKTWGLVYEKLMNYTRKYASQQVRSCCTLSSQFAMMCA